MHPRPAARPRRSSRLIGLGLSCWTLASGSSLLAQSPDDEVGAVRLQGETVEIDGVLSEAVWSSGLPMTGLRQREPDEAAPATERTEVRVAYDDQALYVAVHAFHAEPDRVVARLLQRDRLMSGAGFGGMSFAGDDAVAILLDPFHDHRNGIVLATNANGAEFDALVTDEGAEINVDWRAVWEVAATRTADGWSAEFAIPWRTLRYPDSSDEPWGFNVYRIVQEKQEEQLWRAWSRDGGGFLRVSLAGHLTGLEDLPRSGLNIEVKPFGLGRTTQTPDPDRRLETNHDAEFGLDIKAELRPGLILDLTTNTDFAQVEVDDAQVNLTRFDLFFPEKRDFFLENSGVFEFGQRGFDGPPPFLLFFSRNIGISPNGEVPILAGGRVTGRIGRQTIGLLSVVTDGAHGQDSEVFNVARLKRDIGESNVVGAMVTDRRGDGAASTSVGLDARFTPHPTVVVTGYGARSFTEGDGGDGGVYQAQLDWTSDVWGGFFEHMAIGEDAVAASGFISRTNVRNTQLVGRRTWRPPVLGLRRIELRWLNSYRTTMNWDFQDWESGLWLSSFWESAEALSVQVAAGETQVDRGFPLAGRVDVPAGRYRADRFSVSLTTTSARPWSVSTSLNGSKFYNGHLLTSGGSLSVSPTPSFSISLGVTHNDVDLPRGDFVANITTFRAIWALSTRITTNTLVQHNSLTDEMSTNIRFNFIHRPGSDLFVVFTEGRGFAGDLGEVTDRGLAIKLTWLQRF